ncbi:MAG: acyl carrier protein [Capsulimonadaceae bacterium]
MSLDTRLATVLSAVLEIPVEQVGENTSPDTVATWDSMRAMTLVVSLEEEFGVQFTDHEILEMANYSLIKLTLQEKGVS